METNQYQNRREALVKNNQRTLFVIPSGVEAWRSHSVHYRFKGHSDFHYLTGLQIPGAVLVLSAAGNYLLRPERSELHKIWDGEDHSGDDASLQGLQFSTSEKLDEIIKSHLLQVDRMAVPAGVVSDVDQILLSNLSYSRSHRGRKSGQPLSLSDSRPLVGRHRHIKNASEIELLKQAGARSSRVHKKLMTEKLIGKTEREVANWVEAQFLSEGLQWVAYESIVGSGPRSVILHARASDRLIQKGDLVLIDAGGEWQGYCADITRTMPADAKFSTEQKTIYQAVQKAQAEVIKSVAIGRSLVELHQIALDSMLVSLQNSGLAVKGMDELKTLMPHQTSHWLGLDVHDPSPYLDEEGDPIKLQTGMTFTVEPGLYFRDTAFGEKYRDIGVRIEDDIVVTERGAELLTSVPRDVDEIEDLRRQSLR
jgi:Xaa-Pro aminopeptidase